MIELLTSWVFEKPSQRSFLIRSRSRGKEMWIEISEGQFKFEITVPILDLELAEKLCAQRIERFHEMKERKAM